MLGNYINWTRDPTHICPARCLNYRTAFETDCAHASANFAIEFQKLNLGLGMTWGALRDVRQSS